MGDPAASRPGLTPRPAPAPIRTLARAVAERIAAGEVIERPASVVRELLDNAIDAGASEVRVEIRGGGLELIRVSDDGCGIPPDQLELAFERHATSKIRLVEDLSALRTLGFRGEALASLAAVAEVTLLSRADPTPVPEAEDGSGGSERAAAEARLGGLLVVRAGRVVRRGRAARQPGTTVAVRQLFHNVPARLKFLAGGRGESLLIAELLRRYALAYPWLRLWLSLDGRSSFHASGSGRLEEALAEVYGRGAAGGLLPLQLTEPGGASVSGFVGGHAASRPNRRQVTLIVNGRWAASRGLLAALEAAYRPFLPRGRHPIAAIRVEVPPAELDANVHPAKTEVKLLREEEVADALARAVRAALGRAPTRPRGSEDFSLAAAQYRLPAARRRLAEGSAPAWRAGPADEEEPLSRVLLALRVLAQAHGSLVVAEGPGGVFLIDQHRAHERIVYERLLARPGRTRAAGQSLLDPLVLELKPHQAALLGERLGALATLGFDCERFGGRDFLIRAVPSPAAGEGVLAHVPALLEVAASEEEGWRERLLASLACRAALRRNRPLTEAEMWELVRELAATGAPSACPHGSPLVLQFSGSFLERQFGW